MTTVHDLVARLEERYPLPTAESWDQVGLTVGDRTDPVEAVLCTVDVTPEVVAEAIERKVGMIVAHHPLMLRGVHGITTDTAKGRMVTELIRHRIALWTGHTNADCARSGVADAVADALDLQDRTPLVPASPTGMLNLVVFIPVDHLDAVVDALAEAGAGRIGDYDRCHWSTEGTGSFRPLPGSDPFIGHTNEVEAVTEARVELILPASRRGAVAGALRATHPYEEPAFHFTPADTDMTIDTGLGRVGTLPQPASLRGVAEKLAQVLPQTATGVRLGASDGDVDRVISRVAVLPGAGDSLLDRARAVGAEVYITSDLRHHPAGEFLADPGPALIDIAHWAAEWLWLPTVAEELRATGVSATVSQICTDPWQVRVG